LLSKFDIWCDLQKNKDLPVSYIANVTANLWKPYPDSNPYCTLAVSHKEWFLIHGKSDDPVVYPMNHTNCFINTEISELMACSGAAVSAGFGQFREQYQSIQVDRWFSMTGASLGRWKHLMPARGYILAWILHFFIGFCLWEDVVYHHSHWLIGVAVYFILMLLSLAFEWIPNDIRIVFLDSPLVRELILFLNLSFNAEYPVITFMSDGGHNENLALLPLFVKRYRLIFAADGSADLNQACSDLRRSLEIARKDLGCVFTANDRDHRDISYAIQDFQRSAKEHVLKFNVRYSNGEKGQIIYMKPRRTDRKENKHINGFCCNCCAHRCCCFFDECFSCYVFPFTSTANQLFYPKMFDAYFSVVCVVVFI